ncbi:MAG: NAD(P)/FAD-dependent oxidoreductase [Candidatus Cloacimonadales bacterium]|jgi:digeranylgeranylglycerophospholipid reductase|nr:NAD(P)/FAD-dependent oxidoreductase [Candidatus Cloacimonadota bacterium]MDX9977994.1 NAD(P)/FAD-dependent oxidoreductase [Candidatus Cloacimonadales bacterium]
MKQIAPYYDVIVIGGGPAGSVTARYAAENGASVLILERDREVGVPVRCAEGVSVAGIKPFIETDEQWIAALIKGASLHSPDGNFVEMYNNGDGYVLERRIFDRALADLACLKGATLLTKADAVGFLRSGDNEINGVQFKHQGKFYNINCKIVIGADGIESQVGKWAGINTTLRLDDLETCVQYTVNNIKVNPELCRFYFGREVSPSGYLWLFPKSETQANIGIGISGSETLPGKGPKYYLDKYMENNFPNASINYFVCGGVPTEHGTNFVEDNVMLVGDAARQVNPITGGGIVQAMIAARICGETCAKALKANDFSKKFLSEYEKRWDKVLGANQRFMYSVKKKFFQLSDEKFNRIVQIAKDIKEDDLNLHSLFKVALREDPLLVAKMATSFLASKIKFDW